MEILTIIFFGFFVAFTAQLPNPDEWNAYKQTFKKSYTGEDFIKQIIYSLNKIRINEHNQRYDRGLVKYRLGVNQFTDMTNVQFNRMLGGNSLPIARPTRQSPTKPSLIPPNPSFPLPILRNWTSDGAVTEVKDQGTNCNSGWAFAALAALEGHHFVTYTKLPPSLSSQNLIDCAGTRFSCTGLQTPNKAFEYIINNQNVNTEKAYPYTGYVTMCRYNINDVGTTLGSFEEIDENDDAKLENIVGFEGPVVVGFNAFSFEFQHYVSGIFHQSATVNRATNRFFMAVVGFGFDSVLKENYWILKNSMGTKWGEYGFIRVFKNEKFPIAKSAMFPNV